MASERKDYYKILGISDSEKELKGEEFDKILKKKFRTLSLKYHPDKNPGDKDAEAKFKDIAEAYDVLHNKRDEYDNPMSGFKFDGFSDINDIFGGFNPFSDLFAGMGMNRSSKPRRPRGSDLRIQLNITLEDAFNGVKKKVKYKRYVKCDSCGGSGKTARTKEKQCSACHGSGMSYQSNGFMRMGTTCPHCGGTGKIIENPCGKCNGHGIVLKDTEVEFSIPSGCMNGQSIRLGGMGHLPVHGDGDPGDLYINMAIMPHNLYERYDNDLIYECKVKVLDAITGCNQEIPTIDGKKLSVIIPHGSSDGDKLKINGYGMPISGSVRGNLIVIIRLVVPKNISEEEKTLIEELKTKENFR